MKKGITVAVVVVFLFLTLTTQLFAQDPNLSIYEIQYTENEDGSSYYNEQIVGCNGGIVIHKWNRGRERLILYDPNYPDGWGGILVKGPFDSNVFEDVNLGDWIKLDDVIVYEELNKARGNTTLFYEEYSSCTILSTGNGLPVPLVVDVNEIAVNYDLIEQTCYVTNHRAEKYESMYIQVRMVSIDNVGVGSHVDNYSLNVLDDPNIYCWAADYINIDNPDTYTPHLIVESGLQLCRVSGILEQYTKLSDGWDYYQLLTTEVEDFEIEQIADLDGDCDVDFADFSIFGEHWLEGK
ncbi:MAG: hypothetical protein ACYTFW_05345 [Planctomycetota bacterium]|jgi:hypothetical protein